MPWVSRLTARGVLVVVAGAMACLPSTNPTPMLPCAGHVCAISVQNDGALFLSVRFVDSTGRNTVLGLVGPAAVRLFRVQWVRSATVRVVAESKNDGIWFSDLVLQSARTNELHYPEDFEPVDDLFLTSRPPGGLAVSPGLFRRATDAVSSPN